jgi:hypothetical protein
MESGGQEYSILIIFTNGKVHSTCETIEALEEVKDDPLSIVVVGVGPGDFSDMEFFNEHSEKQVNGNRVQFVDMKAHQEETDALTEETLKEIPQHLVNYFVSKEIRPNPPVETDEIVIEPFNEEEEVTANIVVSESGDVKVESDAKPPSQPSSVSNEEDKKEDGKLGALKRKGKAGFMKQGKRMLGLQTKKFGRMQKQMQKKMDKMVDQNLKKVFKM